MRLQALQGRDGEGAGRVRIVRACDLFCGAGGTSTGLLRACDRLGRPVLLENVEEFREWGPLDRLDRPTEALCFAVLA